MIFFSISDPSAILKIEKAITSGTALVLYNIDRDVDSLFMPLIYHITTAISDEVEKGAVAYISVSHAPFELSLSLPLYTV